MPRRGPDRAPARAAGPAGALDVARGRPPTSAPRPRYSRSVAGAASSSLRSRVASTQVGSSSRARRGSSRAASTSPAAIRSRARLSNSAVSAPTGAGASWSSAARFSRSTRYVATRRRGRVARDRQRQSIRRRPGPPEQGRERVVADDLVAPVRLDHDPRHSPHTREQARRIELDPGRSRSRTSPSRATSCGALPGVRLQHALLRDREAHVVSTREGPPVAGEAPRVAPTRADAARPRGTGAPREIVELTY